MADPAEKTIDQIHEEMRARQAEEQKRINQIARENYWKTTMMYGGGLLGNVGGILLAIKRKSGFWGGVGWFLLIGAAGAGLGYVVGAAIDGRPKQQDDGKDS